MNTNSELCLSDRGYPMSQLSISPEHRGVLPLKGKMMNIMTDEEAINSEDMIQVMRMMEEDSYSGVNTIMIIDGEQRVVGIVDNHHHHITPPGVNVPMQTSTGAYFMKTTPAKRVDTRPPPTSQMIATHILCDRKMKQSRPLRRNVRQ